MAEKRGKAGRTVFQRVTAGVLVAAAVVQMLSVALGKRGRNQ